MTRLVVFVSVICILFSYSTAFGEQVKITLESYPSDYLGGVRPFPTVSKIIEVSDPYDPDDTDDQLRMAHEAILFALSSDGWNLGSHNFNSPSFPPVNPGWTNPHSGTGVKGEVFLLEPTFYENLLGYSLNPEAWTIVNAHPYNQAMTLYFHTDLWSARLSHCIGESPDNYGSITGAMAGVFSQCPVPEWGFFTVEEFPSGPTLEERVVELESQVTALQAQVDELMQSLADCPTTKHCLSD